MNQYRKKRSDIAKRLVCIFYTRLWFQPPAIGEVSLLLCFQTSGQLAAGGLHLWGRRGTEVAGYEQKGITDVSLSVTDLALDDWAAKVVSHGRETESLFVVQRRKLYSRHALVPECRRSGRGRTACWES